MEGEQLLSECCYLTCLNMKELKEKESKGMALSYALKHGVAHLVACKRKKEAKKLLLNVKYLLARRDDRSIVRYVDTGFEGLMEDCELLKGDRTMEVLGHAIDQGKLSYPCCFCMGFDEFDPIQKSMFGCCGRRQTISVVRLKGYICLDKCLNKCRDMCETLLQGCGCLCYINLPWLLPIACLIALPFLILYNIFNLLYGICFDREED